VFLRHFLFLLVLFLNLSLILKTGVCFMLFLSLQIKGYAALVRRGTCDFTTKARVAQKAGAVAVLVINDAQGWFL